MNEHASDTPSGGAEAFGGGPLRGSVEKRRTSPSGAWAGQAGKKVGGYQLIEPLGAGGMGEVWLARHTLLGRLAAVKLIRPDTALSPEDVSRTKRRFEREARATSALRSPHSIAIYDFGLTEQQTFYYAMELLEGVSTETLVEKFGVVPVPRAIHLLRGVCESLLEAHQQGLIHRDIKPANIFTCAMGLHLDFVKVLDFGLVKQLPDGVMSSLTLEGAIAGSPAFMPPESAKGELTEKADVYAVGCVAYWLLTGEFVFRGATALEIMLAHVQTPPILPSERAGRAIPPELEALIMHSLEKSPDKRPGVRELAARLASCAESHPWTGADAKRWWTDHEQELAKANGAIAKARGATAHEPFRDAPSWTERERAAHVDAALARLQHHFTQSHIDVGQLEERLARLRSATDVHQVAAVFADLPVPVSLAAPGAGAAIRAGITPREVLQPIEARASLVTGGGSLAPQLRTPPGEPEKIISVMGSVLRHLVPEAGKEIHAVSVMGGCVLDLRDPVSGPGIMEIRCVAVMGFIEILVPPGIRVDMVSGGFLGSFEQQGNLRDGSPDAPVIRVVGVSVMGSVVVRENDERESRAARLNR